MMSYYGNYGERRSKIPYDEVPITRNERTQRGYSSSRGGMKLGRFASIAVSFTIIANVILSVVCLFLIKNIRPRIINHYNVEVGSTGEVSAVVKNSALANSVSVIVGSSSGSGVVYKVVPDANKDNQGTIYFVTCYHVVSDNPSNEYDPIFVNVPVIEIFLISSFLLYHGAFRVIKSAIIPFPEIDNSFISDI